jgi:hypothetical protein
MTFASFISQKRRNSNALEKRFGSARLFISIKIRSKKAFTAAGQTS